MISAAIAVAGAVALTWAALAGAFVAAPIAIDGDFSDWAGVGRFPANVAGDTVTPNDPDYPGQPDRDVVYVMTTYDSEYLYFAWRRTAGGTKAITFGAYLDLNGDGLLQETDKVVLYTVSSGNPYCSQGRILDYNQARDSSGGLLHPEGDPMGSDGDTPDGWARWQDGYTPPARALDAYLSPDYGVQCEARVAWSDLGLAPGSAISAHFAAGNGEAWGVPNKASTTYKPIGGGQYIEENRGQVEDNVLGAAQLVHRAVSVTPDVVVGAPAGGLATFTHTIRNAGNLDDTYDLTAVSHSGWPTTIRSVDAGSLSSVSLASGEATTVVVTLAVPDGTIDGMRDTVKVGAISRADAAVSGHALDVVVVGSVTVLADQGASGVTGATVRYRFTVHNTLSVDSVYDLTAQSARGWPFAITDASGAPVSSVSLGPESGAEVYVDVAVPADSSLGMQDVTTLIARGAENPQVVGSARATTTVRAPLTIEPDRTDTGAAGAWVTYRHTITNSLSAAQTVALYALSSQGWTTQLFAADGVTPITTVTLAPNGGAIEVVARVFVPANATPGLTDTITIAASANGHTARAYDTTTVRNLATYTTAAYSSVGGEYDLGSSVYARGAGLGAYGNVYFVWIDPAGTTVRTSPTRKVDTEGMAFDTLPLLEDYPEGTWTVELRRASNGTLLDTMPFSVGFDAEITALSATDAGSIGTDVNVDCTLQNRGNGTIPNSAVTYVIWWDEDGNDAFGSGDLWVDAAGAVHVWDGSTPVSTQVTAAISVPGAGTFSDPGWSISNARFPNQGNYNLTATWTSVSGRVIDGKTTQFFSVPTFGELAARIGVPPVALVVGGTAIWLVALGYLHSRRRWLSFYGLGVLGGVMVALFVAQLTGFDQRLEAAEAAIVASIATALGLRLEVLGGSGLAIKNHVGWGVFDIGIECSALIEMAAIAGLVGFYPAFSKSRKGTSIAVGVAATFAFNIARILLIIGIIAWLGTAWVFPAHAIIGRVFFFTAVVLLFWLIMTRPTVHLLRARVEARLSAREA